jgi:alcohol dehydrogenase YqhD (iron-dependent ADH family)
MMDYWQALGMPISLGGCVGVQTDKDLEKLADMCSYDGKRTIGSFVKLDREDMLAIYTAANQ